MSAVLPDPRAWGTRPEELTAAYPCDGLLSGPVEEWFRAVTVRADRATVFRWLCQLRIAPYSYDLLDNFGRRSPRALTPGADALEIGQRVMTIFELTGFERDRHLTMVLDTPWARRAFGGFALSYTVEDEGQDATRLVVKLLVRTGSGPIKALRGRGMAWGDLMMMRCQLKTLRELAETVGR
ncbi:hypothetical protein AB0G97_13750 [Streptomyces sp. NPDC020755]|uniref:hypothetical protein n=1 Tax=unclassified Streptomyces TaxID=2593676 RepID=UPI0022428F8F|nr:hypothetical protein [Streptomyces sp. VB1]UZI27432.1 hypothetical protein OH133_04470 [Streptomyces sp. VB1]